MFLYVNIHVPKANFASLHQRIQEKEASMQPGFFAARQRSTPFLGMLLLLKVGVGWFPRQMVWRFLEVLSEVFTSRGRALG